MKSEHSETSTFTLSIGERCVFQDEQFTIINEDVLTTRAIEKERIDLIVTLRPYNVDIKYNSNDGVISYMDYLIWNL